MTITATEFKTNLGKYIDLVSQLNDEIIVTKNGKKVLKVSRPQPSGAERLAGLIKPAGRKWDYDDLKKAAMEEKHEITL